MDDEILLEISEFCNNECSSNMSCPEEECILYRIEQIRLEEIKSEEENVQSNN